LERLDEHAAVGSMGSCTADAFKFEPEIEQTAEDIFNLFSPMVSDGQIANDSADGQRGLE
jgi:hypothetical protein